jgi:uncharacterized protein
MRLLEFKANANHNHTEIPMQTNKKPRGFAAMTQEKRAAVSRLGGISVSPEKRSFSQNRELASSAGRKGGSVTRKPSLVNRDS